MKKSYLEKYAWRELTRAKGDQTGQDLYLLSDQEQKVLASIRKSAYLKAGIAGALGVILLYVPYHLFGSILFPERLIFIPFLNETIALEVEFLVYSVVLVVIEIAYLTYLNIKMVSAITATCGSPSKQDQKYEENLNSLVLVSLEKKEKELAKIGINPFDGLSKWAVMAYQILLKLKAAMSGFVLKLIVKKLAGRYLLRIFVDLAGIPIYVFWNIWGVRIVMREALVRVMAPPLIKKFVDQLAEEFHGREDFQRLIFPALQTIAVSKRAFHYNHYLLATSLMERFSAVAKENKADTKIFLKLLHQQNSDIKQAIGFVLVFGMILDGRLSAREHRLLAELRESGCVACSNHEINGWAEDYLKGRGLERFFKAQKNLPG